MTATIPPLAMRECRLYRFWVEHPETGQEVLGYIGETVRAATERMMEHLRDQPWFDTVTRWERDPHIFYGKPAVLDAETAAIRAEQPLYNVKGNELNPNRIPPPLAIRQRRARDAARNTPRWVHPADRGESPRPVPASRPPTRQKTGWRPWQKRLAGWTSVWLFLAVDLFIPIMHWHVGHLGWKQSSIGSMALAGAAVGWWLAGHPLPRRKRRRRTRRRR